MISQNKKQKLIAALRQLKVSQLTKNYKFFEYGPKKQELYCFNGWMYHCLYPRTSFKTLVKKSPKIIKKAIGEEIAQVANITHYRFIMKKRRFRTSVNEIIKQIEEMK